MNSCLGLFGFRLVIQMVKSGIAGEYVNIALESAKNIFAALMDTIGMFVFNIIKK